MVFYIKWDLEKIKILPNQEKYFELETVKIYVSVLIEIEEHKWKQ